MYKSLTSSAIALMLFLLTMAIDVAAQGRSNDRQGRSGDAPGRNKGATGVPVDGGIAVLLAAGAAYGVKRLRDYRNSNRNNTPDA